MSDIISMKTVARLAGASVIVLSLGACSQMTKHSNTLVFATNTVDGLKVGTDANQVPTVQLAFTRQEIAFVPVLANTGVKSEGGSLIPCPSATVKKDGSETDVNITNLEDCKFLATHDGTSRDAYSTLASFGSKKGAEIDAKGNVTGTSAVAQYFATGIAAQYLAITGGANVVSAGGDTKAKADAAGNAAFALTDAQKTNAKKFQSEIDAGEVIARSIIGGPDATVTDAKFTALAAKIGYPACNDAALKGLGQTIVDGLIGEMRAKRRPCLAKLGRDALQGSN